MQQNHSLSLFAAGCLMIISSAAAAMPFGAPEESFEAMQPVGDNVLAEQRGGFISAGGLMIDFAITTRTLVDDQIVSDVSFDANTLANLSSTEQLNEVVQIGGGNQLALDGLAANPNVGVVIQNTLDDTVIQNFSILDVAVQNFTTFEANQPLNNALLSAQASAGLATF